MIQANTTFQTDTRLTLHLFICDHSPVVFVSHITLSRLGDHELSICWLFASSPRYSRHRLQNLINLSAPAANERLSLSAPAANERRLSCIMSQQSLICVVDVVGVVVTMNIWDLSSCVIGHVVDRVRSMKIAVLLNNKGVSYCQS